MSEEKNSLSSSSGFPKEIIPHWLEAKGYGYSAAVGVLLRREALRNSQPDLVLTRQGLEKFGNVFATKDGLTERLIGLYDRGRPLPGTASMKIPDGYPNALIKLDVVRKSLETILTLAFLAKTIPLQTDEYFLEPIELYWALADRRTDLLCMELIDQRGIISQDVYSSCISAMRRISREAEIGGIDIRFTLQDLLYRGTTTDGRPRVILVDVDDENITNLV